MTGQTKIIAQRADWESLDPIVWTPWGTLLFAEETNAAARRDPDFPNAVAGLVYEVFFDPNDLTHVVNVVARPAIGSKSHEGMRFDTHGNLYSISERTPGYIFKFVPDKKGDLSRGQTYVMKLTQLDGDRTGSGIWVPLDRDAVQIDASAAADAVGATGYGRPEDVEIATSSEDDDRGGSHTLYAAITSEHRVIGIDLKNGGPKGGVRVFDYVARGLNVDDSFVMPDNLALEPRRAICTSPKIRAATRRAAKPATTSGSRRRPRATALAAATVVRFATLTDCEAEPTGLYFDIRGQQLFVNVQHRGGDRFDKTMAITASHGK